MSKRTKWHSRAIYLVVALTMIIGMAMVPAAVLAAPVVGSVIVSPTPVADDATITITASDAAGGLTGAAVNIYMSPPPAIGLPTPANINHVLTVNTTTASPDETALASELGVKSVNYAGDAYSGAWTIVIDTTKKVELSSTILRNLGWFVGQEVWFDGNYNIDVTPIGGQLFSEPDVLFDNAETMTPTLGLDAKGSEQNFWVNYIDVVTFDSEPEPVEDWTWIFVPGINLQTVGTVGSSADVIVREGGKNRMGSSLGNQGPTPTPEAPPYPAEGSTMEDLPDRFITIWSRAPELGDCVIKVTATEIEGKPPVTIEVAAEKKWGELFRSELDVLATNEGLDHEVWEDADTRELLSEYVEATYINLPDPQPAGGALVNWWLAEDSVENQVWIRALMADIATRAGADGYVDDWTSTGKYDPLDPAKDQIAAWIVGNEASDTYWTEFNYYDDPYVESDQISDTYGWNTTMDRMPGETSGMAYAELENNGAQDDVLVITLVEYQGDYNGENMILIQIGKKHFGEPPPTAQVKTPQVRWAGEKIVLEKDWNGIIDQGCDKPASIEIVMEEVLNGGPSVYIAVFNLEGESIGNLEPIEDIYIGAGVHLNQLGLSLSANQVIDIPMDGEARCILVTEQQGQADVNAALYRIALGEGGLVIEGPIDQHGFLVYFLAFEDVSLAEDVTPAASLLNLNPTVDDADIAVQVKGWFTSAALPPTARAAKLVDINGDAIYDIMLPAGRYILPDDWAVMAGFNYELRPNYDLMDQANNDGIVSLFELGPYDSGVVTTDPPVVAEYPNIGPFSTLQVWTNEDVWFTGATVPSSLLPAERRNTVVPDGSIDWYDCPMPQALAIFDIERYSTAMETPTLSGLDKGSLEGYGIVGNEFQSPFYAVEIPSH
ncbi:hypothetical protein ACFLUS_05645, partial [Chloroflexota bacterium]